MRKATPLPPLLPPHVDFFLSPIFLINVLLSTHSGLVMLETSNNIFNKTLYDLVTTDSLLAWHRVRVANWLASGGKEWAEYVSQYNSGVCEREGVRKERVKKWEGGLVGKEWAENVSQWILNWHYL